MKEKKLDDVLLTGGGIIPDQDMKKLNKLGVGKLFGPGTPVKETIEYIEDWVSKNRR
jgi:methylmalonyl-CoA mutase C-terminal domain/subunit